MWQSLFCHFLIAKRSLRALPSTLYITIESKNATSPSLLPIFVNSENHCGPIFHWKKCIMFCWHFHADRCFHVVLEMISQIFSEENKNMFYNLVSFGHLYLVLRKHHHRFYHQPFVAS
uniref:Maturase K n=1 Tax=Cacopsylla melanoneura TaxID=428564 RepID=A0A8D8PRR4_9HEMI